MFFADAEQGAAAMCAWTCTLLDTTKFSQLMYDVLHVWDEPESARPVPKGHGSVHWPNVHRHCGAKVVRAQ